MCESFAQKETSLRRMLALWLCAMIVLPALPLVLFTWRGYDSEVEQLEKQLQDTNRQIAVLAEGLFGSIISDVAKQLEVKRYGIEKPVNLPFDHAEEIDTNGEILASSMGSDRIGEFLGRELSFTSVEARDGKCFDVSQVVRIDALKSRRVLLRVKTDSGNSYRVAYLDPDYLYDVLTSRFESVANRHIYAIDATGAPIFYSHQELVEKPEVFLSNEPVRRFLDKKVGPVSYISAISGLDRIGYVTELGATGWAIVVSADIAEKMIDIRYRLIWLVAGLLLAGGLALSTFFLFSYRIVFPLSYLAEELGRKDRDPHMPLNAPSSITRFRELRQFVDEFNKYVDNSIEVEKKAVHAEKLATLGELTTGLAHELGTPLNVVRGSAQVVKKKHPEDKDSQVALERIITQSERITDLIRSLLDIARLDKASFESSDLRQLIERAWQTVEVMYPNVEHIFEFTDEGLSVDIKRRSMEHALLNLFINACQAMEGNGLLQLRVSFSEMGEGRKCLVEIEDSGPGIDKQHRNKIFKPFFTTKRSGQGSGLGLALVDRVVREHGGTIAVSRSKHGGAAFKLTLPVSSN